MEQLKQEFQQPPLSAWPRTWWHWTGSNITKEGIHKDLEWMKQAGIAGFQLADVAAGSGQTASTKIPFGSPEWKDAVHYAAADAERLNLEMAVFSSPGWSLAGGPWVKPEQAMKKLVWSEVQLTGGKGATTPLPKPPAYEGAGPNLSGNATSPTAFYQDFAVVAFPTPTNELRSEPIPVKVSSSSGPIDVKLLMDNNTATTIKTVPSASGTAWLQLEYEQPITATAITLAGGRPGIPFGTVQASMDGKNFTTLVSLPGKSGYRGGGIRTYAFPATTARFFRIEYTNAPPRPADIISQATPAADSAYLTAEVHLHTSNRLNRWEDKAGFNFLFEYSGVEHPNPTALGIQPSDIIDLTTKLQPDGMLNWNPPPGNWTVMRFGYALTGAKNRPAVPAGSGYEVDKLSRKHVEAYLNDYTKLLQSSLGALYGKRLLYMMLDSWEAGIQNWTDDMPTAFQQKRGYSILTFLPAMAGRLVGNADSTERFLWDYRRTLVDLFAENFYGTVTEFLHRQGLQTYGEAGGVSLESMEDALLNKKYMDIPMGEFWVKDLHPSSMYYQDVRGAASAGHVYGKNVIAAEAFTGGNFESPFTLKGIADYWFTQGVNRLVFHTSAHQPLDTKPGNTMVGTHLNRNITWANLAKPFTTYLARTTYLLQQGKYAADVLYLLDEGAPSTMPFWGAGLQPALPDGYQYDYINADALLNRLSMDTSGKLTLPDGMQYAVLVLPQTFRMTLPVLQKINALLQGGALVLGPKPIHVPGLSGSDSALQGLATAIWADLDGISKTQRSYGKGKIFWGITLQQVMNNLALPPDLEYSHPLDGGLSWIHRKTGEADIYFLANKSNQPLETTIRCKVSGKEATLWQPDKGIIQPSAYSMAAGFTTVPVSLPAHGAVFVVFSGKTTTATRVLPTVATTLLANLTAPWQLQFPDSSGAPVTLRMDTLQSWTQHPDAGVKYFSGTATYTQSINITKSWIQNGRRILLDLGKTGDIAEVIVNGKVVDTLWKAPYEADITSAVKAGKNRLEIKVTNQWTNRLIGDRTLPDKKVLDHYINPFGGAYQLTESGLMGPVRLLSERLAIKRPVIPK